jgi:hypothetical protein
MATGIIWGVILPFYFIPGVTDIFKKVELSEKNNRIVSKRRRNHDQ